MLAVYVMKNDGLEGKWGYEKDNGPEVWGRLSSDYVLCSLGARQSPVDIMNAEARNLPEIAFNYSSSPLKIYNDGHTIGVAYGDGANWIEVGDARYDLLQFHFHAPSEHALGGKRFDMEMHLVHRNASGELAVVGVLIEKGRFNGAFESMWSNLPSAGAEEPRSVGGASVNAESLLPSSRLSYRYDGSLTTPPCSEGVKWLVLKTPVQMSESQIDAFRTVIDGNARPVQPLNGRRILTDIGPD